MCFRRPGPLGGAALELWADQPNVAANSGRERPDKLVGLGELLCVCCVCGSTQAFPVSVRGGRQTQDLLSALFSREKRLFYEHKRLKELPGLAPPPAGGAAQLISLLDCSQQKAALRRAR